MNKPLSPEGWYILATMSSMIISYSVALLGGKAGDVYIATWIFSSRDRWWIISSGDGHCWGSTSQPLILLIEDMMHHLGCWNSCKECDSSPINWCRIGHSHIFSFRLRMRVFKLGTSSMFFVSHHFGSLILKRIRPTLDMQQVYICQNFCISETRKICQWRS